ncbi:MAG: hypothetical protein JWN45_1092 [Acidobacteriaceae bacterium]|nr:hypothetical protein [Acidobacteriaceae bacterium]
MVNGIVYAALLTLRTEHMRMRTLVIGWLVLLMLNIISSAQAKPDLPVVKSGDIPFYPSLARLAVVSGDVILAVTTDGEGVASVRIENGPPLLAKAAAENVRTWKFLKHPPTVFLTKFSYLMDRDSSCRSDQKENDEVVLKLPADVQISTRRRTREYCDPNAGLDMSEPLKVFLTRCEIDGSAVSCQQMALRIHSKSLNLNPVRFTESEERQGFVVPKEFRNLKSFGLTVESEKGAFTIEDIDGSFLKGKWRLGIDHHPFKESSGLYGLSENLRCVGYVHFQWSEPEPMVWTACR